MRMLCIEASLKMHSLHDTFPPTSLDTLDSWRNLRNAKLDARSAVCLKLGRCHKCSVTYCRSRSLGSIRRAECSSGAVSGTWAALAGGCRDIYAESKARYLPVVIFCVTIALFGMPVRKCSGNSSRASGSPSSCSSDRAHLPA